MGKMIHAGKTIKNQSYVDSIYHPFVVKLGMLDPISFTSIRKHADTIGCPRNPRIQGPQHAHVDPNNMIIYVGTLIIPYGFLKKNAWKLYHDWIHIYI